MPELPFVSIVVPAFNAEDTIEDLLQSLISVDYPSDRYEVLVIDNGSKDNTCQIVEKYPVRLLKEIEIPGPAAARNKGVEYARGDIIAFTDADCVADRDWLKKLVADSDDATIGAFAGRIKGTEPALTKVQAVHNRHESQSPIYPEHWPEKAKRGKLARRTLYQPHNIFKQWLSRLGLIDYEKKKSPVPFLHWAPTSNVAYRKQVFEKVGGFDTNLLRGEDLEFPWRMQLETEFRFQPAPEAIIYHKHRATLRDIFKERQRTSLGPILLLDKYLGLDRSTRQDIIVESTVQIIVGSIMGIGSMVLRILKVLVKRQPYPTYLYEPIVSWVNLIAFRYGMIKVCLAWDKQERNDVYVKLLRRPYAES